MKVFTLEDPIDTVRGIGPFVDGRAIDLHSTKKHRKPEAAP